MASKEATVTMKVEMAPSDELRALLQEIRDRLPARPGVPCTYRAAKEEGGHSHGCQYLAAERPTRAAVQRQALRAVLDVLDGWIEGQRSNHEASQHRGENRGEECWRQWDAADFRRMINDAARQIGVREFDYTDRPKEDTP